MPPDPPSGSRLQHLRAPPTYITLATALSRIAISKQETRSAELNTSNERKFTRLQEVF